MKCTEDAFPTKRLQQLVEVFTGRGCSSQQQLTDAIFIEHCATTVCDSELVLTSYRACTVLS